MSTGPSFRRPTSASSSKAVGASDTETQDCARVRPPAETPKKPTRSYSRPSTPANRPSTPTKPPNQPSGIPIPRQGTRKYTLTRKSSASSFAGASSPSKFILPPRASSPAVTNTVTASGHIASSPDSILDNSHVLHTEPEIMPEITKPREEKPVPSRRSTRRQPEGSDANKGAPKLEVTSGPQQEANDNGLSNQAGGKGPERSEGDRGPDPVPEPENLARDIPLPVSRQNTVQQASGTPAGDSIQASTATVKTDETVQGNTPAVQSGADQVKKKETPAENPDSQSPVTSPPVAPAELGGNDAKPPPGDAKPATSTIPPAKSPPATTTSPANDTPSNSNLQTTSTPQPAPPKPTETGTNRGDATAAAGITPLGTTTPATRTPPGGIIPGLPSVPVATGLPIPSPISLLPAPVAAGLNKPGADVATDVGRINAVWNKWFNASAGSDVYVAPAAHRYDINDELVPDIVVYKLPSGPGESPKWKVVYEGQPGVDSPPPGMPSDDNWENARKRMEDVCARQNQSPQWAVLAIGSWARIYQFAGKTLVGTTLTGGVPAPNPLPMPYKPDPDPNTNMCVTLSMSDIPPFPYAAALQVALKTIFV